MIGVNVHFYANTTTRFSMSLTSPQMVAQKCSVQNLNNKLQ